MADINSMRPRMLLFIRLGVLGMLLALVVACDLVGKTPAKPSVTILSPQNGSQFQEGQDVVIQSISESGTVTRFELSVDDNVVRADPVASRSIQHEPDVEGDAGHSQDQRARVYRE